MACGFCLLQAIFAQKLTLPEDADYQAPLDMELFLAGNYAELRPNHFHAGLDFKTQGTVGFPVYSFADGYVHRVGINAYGYGLVLYVRHPQLGVTSVYAHLKEFSDTILEKVRAKQVELEQNNAEITFSPDELPVKKGTEIAKSGNTGSSGGPHVHFELRDCNDEDDAFFDPMPFFKDKIKDTTPPRIQQIYFYPLGGKIQGGTTRRQAGIVRQPDGSRNLTRTYTAWGRIGLGIKAFDYMPGQANTYGVKYVSLYLEDSLIYNYAAHKFRYSERRFTNTLIDYDAWHRQRSTIMKSFIDPGNKLQMVDTSLGDGTVMIDEEKDYHFRYVLSDEHGNKTDFSFRVKGVRSELPAPRVFKGYRYDPSSDLDVDTLGCCIHMPAGTLYSESDLQMRLAKLPEGAAPVIGNIVHVGSLAIPVHSFYTLSMKLPVVMLDNMDNARKFYIVNLDGGYVGGKYADGYITASVREFGKFALRQDTIKPNAGFGQLSWNRAQLSVTDKGSGVKQFKVWIDDKFVPFDMDNRGRYLSKPRYYGIERSKTHKIRIWVVDRCGNENIIETSRYF